MKDLYIFGTERDARECRRLYDVHARTPLDLLTWAADQDLGDIFVEHYVSLTGYAKDQLRRRQRRPGAVLVDHDKAGWEKALATLRQGS